MKRTYLWSVVVLLNIGVVAACVAVFFNFFTVSVYRKEDSKFLQQMASLELQTGNEAVDAGKTQPDFDFRKPHPYAGYKPQPNVKYSSGETFTNALGFKSPDLGAKAPDEIRIAMVGGSVAFQGSADTNADDIIAKVAQKIALKGKKVSSINAGSLSFISNQELNVLVDDIISQDVDIVVSLDGFNDVHHIMFYNGRVGWPAFRWDNFGDTSSQTKSQCPPYYPSIEPNPRNNVAIASALDNYLENILKMSHICEAFGVSYLAVLQPLKQFGPQQCQSQAPSDDEYFDRKAAFYCQVINAFRQWDDVQSKTAAFVTMADALYDRQDLFIDECHFSLEGNERIANNILQTLEARGFLDNTAHKRPLAQVRAGAPRVEAACDFFDPRTLDATVQTTGLRDIEFDPAGKWRWAVGPESRISFRQQQARPMRLEFAISNPLPGQSIVLSINGQEVKRYDNLPATPWLAATLSESLPFDAQAGTNEIVFTYSLQNGRGATLGSSDQTPYAVSFTTLRCN